MRPVALITILCLLLCAGIPARSQQISNAGTEFWTVFPTHQPDIDGSGKTLLAEFSLFITAPANSSGTVSCGTFSQNFTVTANTVTEVKVPRTNAYINDNDAFGVLTARAIHIKVNAGQPDIVVYSHIFAGRRSAASLVLPQRALGNQYHSFNYNQYNGEGKNYIAIVATEPNTRIRIKRHGADLVPGGILLGQVNDVYEYLSDDDLTGTSVSVDGSTACSRFAMFSGSTGVRIAGGAGCDPRSLDPLYQQAYPVESWGRSYAFIPFSTQSPNSAAPVRTAGQYMRVIAKDDNTHVKIDDKEVAVISAGEVYVAPEPIAKPVFVTADKPVAVAQYALTQSCNGPVPNNGADVKNFGDPDMVILNPIEYAIKDITVYSSRREEIKEQYLNVLIKTAAASSFRINGQTPAGTFRPLPGASEYSYQQLDLTGAGTQTFHLSAAGPFNAIAYGFGDVESYAYSAGTSLASTIMTSGIRSANNEAIDSACVDENYFFRTTLPFRASKISWKMDDNEAEAIQTSPTFQTISINGKTVYLYDRPKTQAYDKAGVHHIKVIAWPVTGTSCDDLPESIEYSFLVNEVPEVTTTATALPCTNTFTFKSKTADGAKQIAKWHWDFGDSYAAGDNESDLAEPEHHYQKPGEYIATLTVSFANGCDRTVSQRVFIDPAVLTPDVVFNTLPDVCLSQARFKITQAREVNGAKGTGTFSGGDWITADGYFDPAKAGPGTFNIIYTFKTDNGCDIQRSAMINVLASPTVSGYRTYAIRNTAITLTPKYGNITGASYRWSPTTGLSSDKVAFPTATPSANTDYQVTVSNGACSATAIVKVIVLPELKIPNTFTPNGDGINDLWNIGHTGDYPGLSVDVFNRYGTLLFHTNGYTKPWDGRYNGRELPTGVYYYRIETGIQQITLSGHVTLIR